MHSCVGGNSGSASRLFGVEPLEQRSGCFPALPSVTLSMPAIWHSEEPERSTLSRKLGSIWRTVLLDFQPFPLEDLQINCLHAFTPDTKEGWVMSRQRSFWILSLLVVALWPERALAQLKVEIAAPTQGAVVVNRPFVEGTVSDHRARVWVVVHPMAVSGYWVQPAVTVHAHGKWKVQVYVGEPGMNAGEKFEIRAVADPAKPLREGDVLADWPKARAISQVIEVTRR